MVPPHSHNNVTVFIADDSLIVRERLVTLLGDLDGIEIVGQASSVPEAIHAIQALKPDAVILDIRMPGGSGLDVLKNVKHDEPATVVIMLTNHPYPQYQKVYLMAGANFFFDKVTEFEKVLEVLAGLKQDAASDQATQD